MADAGDARGLDRLRAPQVGGGRLHRAIQRVAATPDARATFEIAAPSGAGSADAVVRGAPANPAGPPAIGGVEASRSWPSRHGSAEFERVVASTESGAGGRLSGREIARP